MKPSTTILSVRNLRKTITLHILGGRRVRPLDDVSFDLPAGAFLGVVGTSGAGKSSLLKCIYRTYRCEAEAVEFHMADGRTVDLATADDRKIIELRGREIGHVSQFLKAPPRLPATEVVALPMLRRGIDPAAARDRAAAALDRLGIGRDLQSSYPVLFSGGEQQRVNVARALVDPSRLLLLDEPTSALDGENRGRVLDYLREVRATGTSMIGVFHDVEMLSRLADRVLVLERGRVLSEGPVEKVDLPRYIEQVGGELAPTR
jgi:alpha-D-ribose 1-methylphosphonate 5-triphosphate synthase subunit PhnL